MKIGTGEFLLILIVSLIALGPEKMPVYAKKLGKALRTLKEYAGTLSEAIDKDIMEPLKEVKEPLKMATEPLTNISKGFNKPIDDIKKSIEDIDRPKPINNIKTEENSSEIDTTVSISEELNEDASKKKNN